jgi:DNA polymerase V
VLNGFRPRDLEEFGRRVKRTVFKWTGISGFSWDFHHQTLAKIANHFAKRIPGFKGCFVC